MRPWVVLTELCIGFIKMFHGDKTEIVQYYKHLGCWLDVIFTHSQLVRSLYSPQFYLHLFSHSCCDVYMNLYPSQFILCVTVHDCVLNEKEV